MHRLLAPLAALAVLLLAACARTPEPAGQAGTRLTTGRTGTPVAVADAPPELAQLLEGLAYGTPASGGNLTVVPLLRTTAVAAPPADYLTLEEALAAKQVTIKELGEGGNVPELEATSTADRAIFIPFGTIVTGGKQNRMTRRDIVIAARSTTRLPVYCVEQGRWSAGGAGHGFGAVDGDQANYGASFELKMLANGERPQGEVWSKVSEQNVRLNNVSGSSDFRGNFDTPEYKAKLAELAPIRDAVPGERVVGYVAVIDGKAIGCEIFASPGYFAKVWPTLFDGMVVSAAASDQPAPTDATAAGKLAAAYIAGIATSRTASTKEGDQLRYKLDRAKNAGSAAVDPESGQVIYLRDFAKE